MKKQLLPIFALALCAAGFVSCQKEAVDNNTPVQTHTMKFVVSPDVYIGEMNTRTAFDPAANKVLIQDNETIGVAYIMTGEQEDRWIQLFQEDGAYPTLKKRPSDGKFEVSVKSSEIFGECDHFFIIPDPGVELQGLGTISQHKLPQEQRPTADGVSFDPQGDILIGRKITIDGGLPLDDMEVNFKRLFVPFKVVLSDAEGLLAGEKIKSVELSAPAADAPLCGAFSVQHSDQAAEVRHTMSTVTTEVFRTVKATYSKTALAKNTDGTYNVWYVVNPTTLHGNVTVQVTTPTRTLTCLIVPGDPVLAAGRINTVTVKMNKVNTAIKPIVTPDLLAQYNAGETIYVGGVAVNKTTYGDAKTPAPSDALPISGVCFLQDAAQGSYALNANPAAPGLILLPLASTTKPALSISENRTLTASLMLKGIAVTGFTGYMFNAETADVDYLVFDNCEIKHQHNLSYFTQTGVPKNYIIRNCKIDFTGAATNNTSILYFENTASGAGVERIQRIEFVDNVVYSDVYANGSVVSLSTDIKLMTASIYVNHNTFINYVCSSAAVVCLNHAAHLEARNNLVWIDPSIASVVGRFVKTYGTAPTPQTVFNVSRNLKYIPNTSVKFEVLSSASTWIPTPALTELTETKIDPFDGGTFSPQTLTFIPTDAYKQYGVRTW